MPNPYSKSGSLELLEQLKTEILRSLMEGQYSVTDIARQHKMPPGTIRRWLKEEKINLRELIEDRGEELDQAIVDYVRTNLETLTIISQVVGNEDYVKSQSATQISDLVNTLGNQTLRILEATAGPDPEKEELSLDDLASLGALPEGQ